MGLFTETKVIYKIFLTKKFLIWYTMSVNAVAIFLKAKLL
jgi:hypothetical protein